MPSNWRQLACQPPTPPPSLTLSLSALPISLRYPVTLPFPLAQTFQCYQIKKDRQLFFSSGVHKIQIWAQLRVATPSRLFLCFRFSPHNFTVSCH